MRQALKELVTKEGSFQQCVVTSSMISVSKENKGNGERTRLG